MQRNFEKIINNYNNYLHKVVSGGPRVAGLAPAGQDPLIISDGHLRQRQARRTDEVGEYYPGGKY